jgi:stage II sporulation protein P
MYYGCSLRPDLARLLEQPLTWNLRQQEPTVLILHSHATESYTPGGRSYTEASPFRTLDEQNNMLSIGDLVAERLEEAGITVLHDRQLHDYPSYNGSYVNARASMQKYLEEYPSILLVLDLHRDAAEDASGKQIAYTAESKYGKTAKLMMVMGMDTAARPHKNWQENLSLALKLQVLLEKECPGVTRPISLWASRLNQDLCSGAVLVEVGAAGNTRQEALNAAELLSDAIISLAHGCN